LPSINFTPTTTRVFSDHLLHGCIQIGDQLRPKSATHTRLRRKAFPWTVLRPVSSPTPNKSAIINHRPQVKPDHDCCRIAPSPTPLVQFSRQSIKLIPEFAFQTCLLREKVQRQVCANSLFCSRQYACNSIMLVSFRLANEHGYTKRWRGHFLENSLKTIRECFRDYFEREIVALISASKKLPARCGYMKREGGRLLATTLSEGGEKQSLTGITRRPRSATHAAKPTAY